MHHFLDFVIKRLVSHPDDVDIREISENGEVTYYVTIHSEDVGKVIGKNGRTIGAIRNLVMAAASKTSRRISVKVCEP